MTVSRAPHEQASISFTVIIPTLNEEDTVGESIASARDTLGEDAEVVVVDGGSSDRTVDVARERDGTTVLFARGGRGAQLNAGIASASGSALVFLHADTRLDADSGSRMREALEDGAVGGCHRFAVEPPSRRLGWFRLLEAGVNLRTRLFGSATGDQAIFVTREALEAAGGCPPHPLFEDVALVRELRRVGEFRVVAATARTSRRRWEERGFLRTVFLHWLLRAGFAVGVSPKRLADWYARGRSARASLPSGTPSRAAGRTTVRSSTSPR